MKRRGKRKTVGLEAGSDPVLRIRKGTVGFVGRDEGGFLGEM